MLPEHYLILLKCWVSLEFWKFVGDKVRVMWSMGLDRQFPSLSLTWWLLEQT